uniref:Uncharacterized protein n=1 Tax=Oryza rufipogon TaxID=4529 RepID=A0A0E0P9E9_ORYRU
MPPLRCWRQGGAGMPPGIGDERGGGGDEKTREKRRERRGGRWRRRWRAAGESGGGERGREEGGGGGGEMGDEGEKKKRRKKREGRSSGRKEGYLGIFHLGLLWAKTPIVGYSTLIGLLQILRSPSRDTSHYDLSFLLVRTL